MDDGFYMLIVTAALIAALAGHCSSCARQSVIEGACAEKCAPLEARFTYEDLCQCAEAQTWREPGE